MKVQTAFFPIGKLQVDKITTKTISSEEIIPAVCRHILGDWGKITKRQRLANESAVSSGKSVRSVYYSTNGVKFAVTTTGDRIVTTVKIL